MQRLARFTDVTLSDPATFGGGSARGHVRTRSAIVAYGYLGVVEEYEDPDTTATWCLLTMSLPGLAPYLAVDHRSAFGRPGVPAYARVLGTGDPVFDDAYATAADDQRIVEHILTVPVRQLLIAKPVQRLLISGGHMVMRTFDGASATDDVIGWLADSVEGILSSTPSFVTPRSGRDIGLRGRPLAPGLYGQDEPPDGATQRADRSRIGGIRGSRTRHA